MMLESPGFIQKEQDTTALILAETCGTAVKHELDEQSAGGKKINFVSYCKNPGKKCRGSGIMVSVGTIAGRERQLSDLQAEEERGTIKGRMLRVSTAQIHLLESDLNMAFAVSS